MRSFLFSLFILLFSFSVTAQVTVKVAEDKIAEKNYTAAIKILDKLLTTNENDTVCYFLRGRCYYELHKLQQAYNDLTKYIDLHPRNALAYLYRGYLLEGTEQYFDAINDFNVAIKYGKDTAVTSGYYHRGSCYLSVNNKKQAYNDLMVAHTRKPEDKFIRLNLGTTLCDMDSLDRGISIFKQLLKEDAKDYIACQNIGFFCMQHDQFDTALVYINRAIAIDPKMAATYNNRGFLKHKMNDNKGAMEDINTSIKLDKSNSYAYKNRALVYIAEGRIDKACEDLSIARQLGFAEKYGTEVTLLIDKNCNK